MESFPNVTTTCQPPKCETPVVKNSAVVQFYRRKLPEICKDFSSAEGREIFKEALSTGHMECYFNLASQFRTQEEPAFCGLSTLVMVLNALAVDPGKIWKGPWRWYHENMLECCVPLEEIKEKGITLTEFVCIAACNGLTVNTTQVDDQASYDTFKTLVEEVTKQDVTILVCSYSRRVLNQTGDGHFSPIGGYNQEKELVLLLDVARFKYPPHWIKLTTLWEAMKAVDKETGLPRGYCLMQRNQELEPLLLFRTSSSLCRRGLRDGIDEFLQFWESWLNDLITLDTGKKEAQLAELVEESIKYLIESSHLLRANEIFLTTQIDLKCCTSVLMKEHQCVIENILQVVKISPLYTSVENVIESNPHLKCLAGKFWAEANMDDVKLIQERCGCSVDLQKNLNDAIFVTALLYAWPYASQSVGDTSSTRGALLYCYLNRQIMSLPDILKNELKQLGKQLRNVLRIYRKVTNCSCTCSK